MAVLCPVLVGRAAELNALVAALEQARGGTGSVAFVLGEPGIGKSRLAREVTARARHCGMVVLRGRAVPGGSNGALRPLAEALLPYADSITSGRPTLDRWLPALAGMVPGIDDGGVDRSPAVRGEALVRVLAELARGRGGLLVLEDLHWADPDTLGAVEHLTDNLERAAVLALVTIRVEEPNAGRDLARVVASRRTALVLELSRLNAAQASAMVYECMGGAGDVDVARIVDAADGVPFLVEELLASPGVPRTFAETVERRLGLLSVPARSVLASAATLGRVFDWHLLPAASRLDDAVVADALEQAVGAQLLTIEGDCFRFRHALTREAVLESVLPPRRPWFASSALAALDRLYPTLPVDQRELAASLAQRADQPERAGGLFASIGADALSAGALASAAAALERTTELLPAGADRLAAAVGLVQALAHSGRLDEALTASESLLRNAVGDVGAITHLHLARAAMAATRWDLAAHELRLVRDLLDARAPGALGAELAVREAELAIGTGDLGRARDRAAGALAAAGGADAHEVACEALLLGGRAERSSSLEAAHSLFAQAAALADTHHLPVWQLRALQELGTIDMLDKGGTERLLRARQLADELGAPATAAVLDLELCAAYSIVGDLASAVERGLAAAAQAGALGHHGVTAGAHVLLSSTYLERGDRALSKASADCARAAAPADPMVDALVTLSTDALGGLLDEDRAAAVAAFNSAMLTLAEIAISPPASFRGVWPLLLAVDAAPDAAAALDQVEASGVTVNRLNFGYLQLARAVLAGREGDPDASVALAADGDRHLRHGPFWHQLGRRLIAEAAAVDGWGDARRWATEAETFFVAHGLPTIALACHRIARGSVPRRWPFAELHVTQREAEVLALVRQGLSNKEIAGRIFVSPRTVEKHIESLLRKTNMESRARLVHLASEREGRSQTETA